MESRVTQVKKSSDLSHTYFNNFNRNYVVGIYSIGISHTVSDV